MSKQIDPFNFNPIPPDAIIKHLQYWEKIAEQAELAWNHGQEILKKIESKELTRDEGHDIHIAYCIELRKKFDGDSKHDLLGMDLKIQELFKEASE